MFFVLNMANANFGLRIQTASSLSQPTKKSTTLNGHVLSHMCAKSRQYLRSKYDMPINPEDIMRSCRQPASKAIRCLRQVLARLSDVLVGVAFLWCGPAAIARLGKLAVLQAASPSYLLHTLGSSGATTVLLRSSLREPLIHVADDSQDTWKSCSFSSFDLCLRRRVRLRSKSARADTAVPIVILLYTFRSCAC